MPSTSDWEFPRSAQPKPEDYNFDLEQTLNAVVGLHAIIPADAFTAETLGTERGGNGVFIRDGVVLTIGYLITEAQSVWLTLNDGRAVQGTTLAYDQETGFGLVQALARLDVPNLPLGNSGATRIGDPVVIGGAGGKRHSLAARIVAKQEYTGYWEYLVDEAIFTAPAHPNWGGTAMIGADGELLGIGSLQLQQATESGQADTLNMIVPIDLLKPILNDLITTGRTKRPMRPWLGVYATESDDNVVIVGLATRGPAQRANIKSGDVVVAVAGSKIDSVASMFRRIWSLGNAGVEIPLTIVRDGRTMEVRVMSSDRNRLLKGPTLQ
ncbi:MAG: S1C family serine protease [Xanthobacteraceae bacterium]